MNSLTRGNWLALIALIAVFLLDNYALDHVINSNLMRLVTHRELVLAVFIAGMLMPALVDQSRWIPVTLVIITFIPTIIAWFLILGLPAYLRIGHPEFTFSWLHIVAIVLTLGEYMLGMWLSFFLYEPRAWLKKKGTVPPLPLTPPRRFPRGTN